MSEELRIIQVSIFDLEPATYNPRKWTKDKTEQLKESIQRFGLVDPILVNGSKDRRNIVIGGHFRLQVAKDLGYAEVPVVYIDIANEAKESELNLRLNKNLGEWDFDLLKKFDQDLLNDVGFSSMELDDIYFDENVSSDDTFDLTKELKKLDIENITVQKGDIYQLGDSASCAAIQQLKLNLTR